ncbi:MAG: hypothetical protein HGB17_12440 [Syntrophobacteraceae bacterium]|nr:hypothetical protein [Syntrophobacteraceae bacterium]
MKKKGWNWLYWMPRVLGILFILFVMMFSMDVFGMGAGTWETLLAFLVHNLPAFALLIFLLLGWRWEWVAGVGFILFGAWYIIFAFGVDPWALLTLGGIPLVIGFLFLAGWMLRKKTREMKKAGDESPRPQ